MKKDKYILAMDNGTTSSRAFLFDKNGNIVATSQKETTLIYPKSSWVEQNPLDIYSTQASVCAEVTSKLQLTGKNIEAIGITNQRETVIVWDKTTGQAIYNAISWQDKRTLKYCEDLKNNPKINKIIREKTGLIIDSYFSASKIRWILDNVPQAQEKADKGQLSFGTVDSWLIYCFTQQKEHLTDVSNASRTMLFNIHTLKWDDELLEIFNIPRSMLPEVKDSSGIFCKSASTLFSTKIPISGVAGDQQASLFGQLCIKTAMAKTTYGTGSFTMINIGNESKILHDSLITTVAWKIGDEVVYALEGTVFMCGAIIQWLKDQLHMFYHPNQTEAMANSVDDNAGVYIVPAFTGLAAPHWEKNISGIITGLTQMSNKCHIVRAGLEAIAFQVNDIIKICKNYKNLGINKISVDGGVSQNDFLMQFQADISQCEVIRPKMIETTVLGVAYMAGLATGFWDFQSLKSHNEIDRVFKPKMPKDKAEYFIRGWEEALKKAFK